VFRERGARIERLLAVYLSENIGLGPAKGPSLVGLFSGLLYTLPVAAGTFVDHYGFTNPCRRWPPKRNLAHTWDLHFCQSRSARLRPVSLRDGW